MKAPLPPQKPFLFGVAKIAPALPPSSPSHKKMNGSEYEDEATVQNEGKSKVVLT